MTLRPVLQIEDDPNDVMFLQHAFRMAGITNLLHVARDAEEAMAYLSGHGQFADRMKFPLPCLVLLDLKMPVMSGFGVLEWMRRQNELSTLVVVVLTGSNHRADVEKAYRLGANSYLVKPSSTEKLAELAVLIKSYWLTENEMPPECSEEAGNNSTPTGHLM